MVGKQAKIPQTAWTRGGRDISNTAIPLYQENLTRLGDYLNDPSNYIDQYLNKYYGANAIQNQDFLRAYNRAMGNRTGANYAATGGGYTSSGQRAYDDQQRYYNDLMSRLQQYGVGQSRSMYDQDVANMRGANADYYNAYQLGQPYSQYEQYNSLVDQANNNWWSGAMSAAGGVLSAIPTPVTMGVGAALQGAGALTSLDTSGAQQAVMNPQNYNAVNYGNWGSTYTNLMNNLNKQGVTPAFQNWLGNTINNAAANRTNKKVAAQNAKTGLNLRGVQTP